MTTKKLKKIETLFAELGKLKAAVVAGREAEHIAELVEAELLSILGPVNKITSDWGDGWLVYWSEAETVADWNESAAELVEKLKLKSAALAKLTKAEREVLGYAQ